MTINTKAFHGTLEDITDLKTIQSESSIFGSGLYLTTGYQDAYGYSSNKTSNMSDENDWNRDLGSKLELQANQNIEYGLADDFPTEYTRLRNDLLEKKGKVFEVDVSLDNALIIDEKGIDMLCDKSRQKMKLALVESNVKQDDIDNTIRLLGQNGNREFKPESKFEWQLHVLKGVKATQAVRQYASISNKSTIVIKNANKYGLTKDTNGTNVDHIQVIDDKAILSYRDLSIKEKSKSILKVNPTM
jgi:hypothetical protein